jgi:hypothetical protein
LKKKLIFILVFLVSCSSGQTFLKEVQLTFDQTKNHDLDNNDNFSPDGKWLVYDTRTDVGGVGSSASVEQVNIETGKIMALLNIPDNKDWGPGAGAASYHPSEMKVISIHGLPVCTKQNPYQQWRRTATIVNVDKPNVPVYMDSRNVTSPFTPGALRGGTHRHEWSRDGQWIGFTYNDAIMKKLEDSTGVKWNLRTIAVSTQKHKVKNIDSDPAKENVQGEWYSAVVVRVVPNPAPGSDEISNAASDSWIGPGSYRKPDGKMQVARAFLGKIISKSGKPVDELFVVDIPDSINMPGEYGSLEGTRTSFPMPPKGTVQRRLTHTAETKYPGCSGVARSSSDGKYISYLAKDSLGIQQVYLISPPGGRPVQLTKHITDVQCGVRWSPDNRSVIYLWDNSIVLCEVSDRPFDQRFKRLTARTEVSPENIIWSNDGKTIAFNRTIGNKKQIFYIRIN